MIDDLFTYTLRRVMAHIRPHKRQWTTSPLPPFSAPTRETQVFYRVLVNLDSRSTLHLIARHAHYGLRQAWGAGTAMPRPF